MSLSAASPSSLSTSNSLLTPHSIGSSSGSSTGSSKGTFSASSTHIKVGSCFTRTKEWFDHSWIGRIYYRYDPYRPFGMYAYNFLSSTYNMINFSGIFNIYKLTTLLRKDWNKSSLIDKFRHVGKILFILSIPFALYGLGVSIKDLITKDDRWSAILRMGENLSWLGSSTGTLIWGLYTVGMGGLNALILAFSFYAVGGFLSISTTILNALDLDKRASFKNTITKLDAVACWDNIRAKSTKKLAELLNVTEKIATLFKMSISKKAEKDQPKAIEKAFASLKNRIHKQVLLGRLAVVSSSISFVGTIILLFTPIFPLACTLLALSAVLSMIRFYYNHRDLQDFKKSITS